MIKILGLGLIMLLFSSCGQRASSNSGSATAQDSLNVTINHDTIKTDIMIVDDLKLDKRFERFDQVRFDKGHGKSFDFETTLNDGTLIRLNEWADGKSYTAIPSGSYFRLLKIYYPNGNIKKKGWAYVDYFQAGIWYEFSEEGELVREVDYDEPFTFTFDDILKFCKANNIEVAKGHTRISTGPRTSISREVEDCKCSWWIEHYLSSNREVEVIKLDGKTGEIIKRKTSPFELE